MTSLPPFGLPPPWTNQNIVLYHGTVNRYTASIQAGINVRAGSSTLDFGLGFYTTTLERQARYWAWQASQRFAGTQPTVISFEVDREKLAPLHSLWFVRGDYDADDFWSFVFHCRLGNNHKYSLNSGWYDVVIGPVTNPYPQRAVMPDYDQISFHTSSAAAILDVSHRESTSFDAITGLELSPWSPL